MDSGGRKNIIKTSAMKVKRDKIVLIVSGIQSFSTLLSPKRDSLTQFQPVGPSKFAVAVVSPIY